MGSFGKITSSRMKFCVMLCNLLIRLINCSPPAVTVSRLLVQFNVILCMYSMCMNDLLFMITIIGIVTFLPLSGQLIMCESTHSLPLFKSKRHSQLINCFENGFAANSILGCLCRSRFYKVLLE